MKNAFRNFCGLCLIGLTALACSKEIETGINPEPQVANKHSVKVVADYIAVTKTEMLPAGNQTKWTDDDVTKMHFFENGIAPDAADLEVSLNSEKTELTITAEFANTDVDKYVYTSILASNLDADKKAILDDEQFILDGTFDPLADILVAKPEEFDANQNLVDFTMQYKRVVAINKIKIKGLTEGDVIQSVTISSNKALLGSYNMTSDTWTNSGTTLELTAYDDITVPASGEVSLWFITAPVTDATLSIYVVTDNHQYEKDFTKTISFAANTVTSFATTVASSEVEIQTGTGNYIRVDSTGDLVEGDYVLVTEKSGNMLNGISTTSTKYGTYESVTITAGEIAADDVSNDNIIHISAAKDNGEGYTLQYDEDYLSWTSGNSLNTASQETNNTRWNISISSGNATISNVATSTRTILWNASSGSERFATYDNKTPDDSGKQYHNVQLYKKDEGGATKSALAKPVISTEKTETLDGIIVSWTDVTKAANYTVSCTGQEAQTIAAGVQTATFANLEPGTYTVSVTANPANTDRNTASTSDEVSVEILDYQLVAPTVSFSGNTTTSIVATWNTADYEAGKVASYSYSILDGETVVVAETTVTTGGFEATGLTSNHTYTVKFKVNGEEPYKGTEYVSLSTKTLKESLRTIAEIKEEIAQSVTTFEATLTNAIVTRKYSASVAYLQDATAGILVTDAADLTEGDSYTGAISGSMGTNQNQPRISSIDVSGATKTTGASIEPETVTIAALVANMSSYDGKLCKIVKAKANGTLATGTNKNVIISQGESSLTLFTRPSFAANTIVENSYYDVIGVPCLYNTTNEIVVVSTDDVAEASITWQLKSIAIKTAPTKLSYTEGETFDPTGLVLSTIVEDASDASIYKAGEDVPYASAAASFSFNPDLDTELATSNTAVEITYGGKTANQEIEVYAAGDLPTYATNTIDFESALTTYADWSFDKIVRHNNSSMAAAVTGSSYYGVNANSETATSGVATASITSTNVIAKPKKITFYYSKESTNSNASSWKVQTSTDGETWTDVNSVSAAGASRWSWSSASIDITATNCYVRIYYDGNTAIRAIDQIVLTYQTN